MALISFSDCFLKYGAKLVNPMWAVSAEADDGSIVISCWANYFSRPDKNVLRYTDTLSRWQGNGPGNKLLREHIDLAIKKNRPIRLVIATTPHIKHIEAGRDASKISKVFRIRPELVGEVVSFDGDAFVIDFCQSGASRQGGTTSVS